MKSKKPIIFLIISIILVIICCVDIVLLIIYSDNAVFQIIGMIIGGFLTGGSISFFIIDSLNNRERKESKEEVEQYYNALKGSVRLNLSRYAEVEKTLGKDGNCNLTQNDKDLNKNNILELMLANMKEIKEYYVLSKSQAKKAFATAIVMGVLGFILIGVSIILAVLFKENIAATIVPAIGAVIIEFLSAVFLFIYKKSLEQLNHYYAELHDNEKFLSAVNLVSNISKDKQDDIFIEIIESRLTIEKSKNKSVER